MDKIRINVKDINPDFQVDGISISSQLSKIGEIYGIPAALNNVDRKFKTHTFYDVLKAATEHIDCLVEDDKIQVLDPRSVFLEDEQFDEIITLTETVTGCQVEQNKYGFQRTAKIKLQDKDSDHFLGDAFSRNWQLTRRADGGVNYSTGIVRLACTNGMTIKDSQFGGLIRSSKVDEAVILGAHDLAQGFSIEEYLSKLFLVDGKPLPCSVAEMMEMYKCLQSLTNDDVPDMLFPIEAVKDFYAAQDIDVTKLARKYLDKLPTGLTYYQALQILTNGAKQMVEKTIDNEIKIARFCAPPRMNAMKQVDLIYNGMPKFSTEQLQYWMGDRH